MRYSQLLIPTSKEIPNDAVLQSHISLVRGGFIQHVGSGLYNLLPLGKIVLEKIKKVIKDELDEVGAQEVSLSFVTPLSLWEESGRAEKYGKELLRFKDRKDNAFVLGPTHEEMMVNLVRGSVKSYKSLPLNLYQINTKFRDEIRPRFGLVRGREFLMKDGYSFHANEEDMLREFALMEATYSKIFTRLGIDFRVVEADSGAIGGSGSKEFMAISQSGEDTLVVCKECDYGANIEAGVSVLEVCEEEAPEADFAQFYTPNLTSIEELVDLFKVNPYYMVKIVAKKALYDDNEEIVLFALRGSDELEETKATNSVNANELVDVSIQELEIVGLVAGFMGVINLDDKIRIIYDKSLLNAKNMITGANKRDYHFVGVNLDINETKDIRAVKEGDKCIHCAGELSYTKGIEVGHIFQLGTRYSAPLKAEFLDEFGKAKPFVMGTYGIGVSRLISVILEQSTNPKGAIWTKQSRPFDIYILISNVKNKEQYDVAFELYKNLKALGYSVLIDDRNDRFGSKIKDFELLGIPYSLVIGNKIEDKKVELINRSNDSKELLEIETILESLKSRIE
jgi:prolyl-tRNA synthetase